MKKSRALIKFAATVCLIIFAVFALASCIDDELRSDDDTENLCLVDRGEVRFKVVTSSNLDTKGIKQVKELIAELKGLGLEIPDEPLGDKDASLVTECEIVFGTGVLNREGCSVDVHDIGDVGYVIKIVGDRVIVAAGSNDALKEAIELFKKKVMGITSKTDTLEGETIKVERKYSAEKLTEYPIASVQIGNTSLSEYFLSFDSENIALKAAANKLRETIYEKSGIWLRTEGELSGSENVGKKFILRLSQNLGEDNFKVYVSEGELIMECSAADRMDRGVSAFLEKYFNDKLTLSRFFETDVFTYDVVALRYSEFGAVGDGKTDDFEAIINTHNTANIKGLKVMADAGKRYYIGAKSHGKRAYIKTDVDWLDAEFIIDDSIILPTGPRGYTIFNIEPDGELKTYYSKRSAQKPGNIAGSFDGNTVSLNRDATSLPDALKSFIEEKSLVTVYNEEHQVYIRYGANSGTSDLREQLIVNDDGSIDTEETPIVWDYEKITKITVLTVTDKPIIVSGGKFTTRANKIYTGFTKEELDEGWLTGNQYYYYNRGICITRPNVTVKNIEHYVTGEGDQGYPYGGFLAVQSYNFTAENCILTAHKLYYENRPGGNGTAMGSYDISISGATDVTFKNCRQSNSITDESYWGIMNGNFGKNIAYDGCTLSRFDAHTGIWGARIVNTTLGHSFTMIGGGELYVDNVKKMDTDTSVTFLSLRGDYGCLWRGDITIKNSTVQSSHKNGVKSVTLIQGEWKTDWKSWYFGYDLYMPQNITVDNFKCVDATVTVINWRGLTAAATTCQYPVYTTKSVTVLNQSQPLKLATAGTYIYDLKNAGKLTVTGDNIT